MGQGKVGAKENTPSGKCKRLLNIYRVVVPPDKVSLTVGRSKKCTANTDT